MQVHHSQSQQCIHYTFVMNVAAQGDGTADPRHVPETLPVDSITAATAPAALRTAAGA